MIRLTSIYSRLLYYAPVYYGVVHKYPGMPEILMTFGRVPIPALPITAKIRSWRMYHSRMPRHIISWRAAIRVPIVLQGRLWITFLFLQPWNGSWFRIDRKNLILGKSLPWKVLKTPRCEKRALLGLTYFHIFLVYIQSAYANSLQTLFIWNCRLTA